VRLHSGTCSPYLTAGVTHVVCTNLSGSKTQKPIKGVGRKFKIVHPDWIAESVRRKMRLSEHGFTVTEDPNITALPAFFNVPK